MAKANSLLPRVFLALISLISNAFAVDPGAPDLQVW